MEKIGKQMKKFRSSFVLIEYLITQSSSKLGVLINANIDGNIKYGGYFNFNWVSIR